MNESLRKSIEKILKYTINSEVDEDYLIDILEEIVDEYEHLQDKYNDLEKDIEDNYRPIPYAEQVGISDRDFI